jgi:hypothetical protein
LHWALVLRWAISALAWCVAQMRPSFGFRHRTQIQNTSARSIIRLDPLAGGNVTEERVTRNAIVWVSQSSASKVAVRVSDDGKQLLLMRAMDVSVGVTDAEEFKITSSSSNYLMAEERLLLGVALIIVDVRTMKMVWSFNGQGMLGLPPSPPAEKATASQDQARQASTGDGTGNWCGIGSDDAREVAGRRIEIVERRGVAQI